MASRRPRGHRVAPWSPKAPAPTVLGSIMGYRLAVAHDGPERVFGIACLRSE
jgi:hypothetical protein